MRTTILRWAWQMLKPTLIPWLRERVLRLPAHQRDALAQRLRCPHRLSSRSKTRCAKSRCIDWNAGNPNGGE